ncbi:MAG: hypothetical protein GY845_17480 [Planctomycetes bacterium]|nr:hypothetical protein [Planctomycetota bacterium]
MDEVHLAKLMRSNGLDLNEAESLEEKCLIMERVLKYVLKPRNISDRTSIRNLIGWLKTKCEDGTFNDKAIFRRVIDFALEASGPKSKNQMAVFMSILKKEIRYLRR